MHQKNILKDFHALIIATTKDSTNQDCLFNLFNHIITCNNLDCREKIGAFALIKEYESYPVIRNVLIKTQSKETNKFDFLNTVYNYVKNQELVAIMNSCKQ